MDRKERLLNRHSLVTTVETLGKKVLPIENKNSHRESEHGKKGVD